MLKVNSGATAPEWETAAGWSLAGNTGTDPVTNFIGTTDAQDFVLRTNNTEKMRIASGGNVGVGTPTPQAVIDLSDVTQTELIRLTDETNTASVGFFTGTGDPNAVVTAEAGSFYLDQAGGAYINTDGSATWTDLLSMIISPDKLKDLTLTDDDLIYDNGTRNVALESTKLVRSDNGVLETATAGVEYFSPNQHGSYFGTVYRQYHGAKANGGSITTTGITKLLEFAGRFNTINAYNGYTDQGSASIRMLKSTNKIDIIIVGTMPINEGWVDYTK